MHLLGMRQHPQVRGDVSEQPLFEWDPATQSVALRKSFPILCLAGRPNAGGWHFSDSSASPHWVGAMPLCRPSMARPGSAAQTHGEGWSREPTLFP